ncbi:hypothetical protein ACTXT7_007842 [Hymenolepis weldensis]
MPIEYVKVSCRTTRSGFTYKISTCLTLSALKLLIQAWHQDRFRAGINTITVMYGALMIDSRKSKKQQEVVFSDGNVTESV